MVATSKPRKPRLAAIEYIRGISMMGVIGIHVGSQYLENPAANVNLVALFEVFTRFSVPIFFFISAFGLFYNLDLSRPFSYKEFMKRRFKTVLVPYLVWSLFYLLHDGWLYGVGFPDPLHLLTILFFGNAKYQLYFLVILLWFYLMMPLWIWAVRHLGRISLVMLFLGQIAFNYWSSFDVAFNLFVYGLADSDWLKPFLQYRLNYWVLHYIFIFLLGGYLAVHINSFMQALKDKRHWITGGFYLTLAALLIYYYELLATKGYTPIEAINTAHQLSPAGVCYTLAASLFFFMIFTYQKYPSWLSNLLHLLGKHSYFAYLVHPLVITYLALLLRNSGHLMTAPIALGFYLATLVLAMVLATVSRSLGEKISLINELSIGVYKSRRK